MVREYLTELFKHWQNAASYVALVFALFAGIIVAIVGQDLLSGSLVGLLIAEISLVIAGYGAWKELKDKLPRTQPGDVRLVILGVEFDATWSDLFPTSPARFGMRFELHNRTHETVHLRSLELATFETGSSLLSPKTVTHLFKRSGGGNYPITLPLRISDRNWETDLIYEILVDWKYDSKMEFARRICELRDYKFTLAYDVVDADSKTYHKTEPHLGSFDGYRKQLIKHWQGEARQEEYGQYVQLAEESGCA
jgi:hypothetical protein